MTVNLAWRDAMAEIGRTFNKTEQSAGWAESFTVWQIAMLQRPWKSGDKEGRRACNALSVAMGDACKTANLTHRTLMVDIPAVQHALTQAIRNRSWETSWSGQERSWFGQESEGQRRERLWRAANPPPTTKTEQREEIRVTAEAFAAWLAANEIEPSRHVAAWFKAMGVNTDRRPIEPPAGWKAQSPHGLQRIDNTDAGRLVRMADLVQWLMDTRELPCKAAVEALCSVLEQRSSAAAGWLYLLTEADYARLLQADYSFSWEPDPLSFGDSAPPVADTDKGLAGAIKYMRQYWGESPAPAAGKWMGQHVLDPLAVRLNVAHLQWGYGRRVEVAEQTQAAAPAEPAMTAPAEKRRVLKKTALVQKLLGEWPTIEQDLSEASRNGLNAAKAEGHGNWDVDRAKAWAESKGKLVKAAQVHMLQAAWPGNVTAHRSR